MSFRRVPITLLAAITLGPLLLVMLLSCSGKPEGSTTDLSKYQKVLHYYSSAPVFAHFPRSIPPDPSRVRFCYYDPGGWGQGGDGQTELWMKLEPGEIDSLYVSFKKQERVTSSSSLVAASSVGYSRPTRPEHYFTMKNEAASSPEIMMNAGKPELIVDLPIPSDFEVIELDNTGFEEWYRGVAISKKRGEIIYYAGFAYIT